MTLGPVKHEKAARIGRISNVLGLREHEMRSNPCIIGGKIPFDPNIIILRILWEHTDESNRLQ